MSEAVRIGELALAVGRSVSWLRRAADRGAIPSVRTEGGHRRFVVRDVQAALDSSAGAPKTEGWLTPLEVEPSLPPVWQRRLGLENLEEDLVWRSIAEELRIDRSTPAARTLQYAFTEMLNNAIDHSGGVCADVQVWQSPELWAFRIDDDGEGVFPHLRTRLNLPDDLAAIQELTKGKRTTMAERHSGEGIFFTSKAVDTFRLTSAGLRWTVDNIRSDQAVGISQTVTGTSVFVAHDRHSQRELSDVFARHTHDHEFVSTQPIVKLFGLGTAFVSRSEARRLLAGMEDFVEVVLDFEGVTDVGQGFVDEIFRVWPALNPGKRVDAINMNRAVRFMVERTPWRGSEPPYGIEP